MWFHLVQRVQRSRQSAFNVLIHVDISSKTSCDISFNIELNHFRTFLLTQNIFIKWNESRRLIYLRLWWKLFAHCGWQHSSLRVDEKTKTVFSPFFTANDKSQFSFIRSVAQRRQIDVHRYFQVTQIFSSSIIAIKMKMKQERAHQRIAFMH